MHLRSQINAFVTHLLESIISRLATREISIFYLAAVAEQAGLNLTLLETRRIGILVLQPILGNCEGSGDAARGMHAHMSLF